MYMIVCGLSLGGALKTDLKLLSGRDSSTGAGGGYSTCMGTGSTAGPRRSRVPSGAAVTSPTSQGLPCGPGIAALGSSTSGGFSDGEGSRTATTPLPPPGAAPSGGPGSGTSYSDGLENPNAKFPTCETEGTGGSSAQPGLSQGGNGGWLGWTGPRGGCGGWGQSAVPMGQQEARRRGMFCVISVSPRGQSLTLYNFHSSAVERCRDTFFSILSGVRFQRTALNGLLYQKMGLFSHCPLACQWVSSGDVDELPPPLLTPKPSHRRPVYLTASVVHILAGMGSSPSPGVPCLVSPAAAAALLSGNPRSAMGQTRPSSPSETPRQTVSLQLSPQSKGTPSFSQGGASLDRGSSNTKALNIARERSTSRYSKRSNIMGPSYSQAKPSDTGSRGPLRLERAAGSRYQSGDTTPTSTVTSSPDHEIGSIKRSSASSGQGF
ncbi:unnamed protein product, partial [Discosporangium mesarthrocarpum]